MRIFNAFDFAKDNNRCFALFITLAVLLGISVEGVAAPRGDIGSQILHELEPERHVDPDPTVPKVDISAPMISQEGSDETIFIKKINFVFLEEDLLKETKPHMKTRWAWKRALAVENEQARLDYLAHQITDKEAGKELSFKQLVKLAEAVTLKMRAEGYITALAYLPQQQMQDDVIKMNIMLGTYDDVLVMNESAIANSRMGAYTSKLTKGRLIRNDEINRSLLTVNDMPGTTGKASLAPGDNVGTAKMIYEATILEKQGAAAYVDNWGNKSTGRYRYGLNYYYNNLAKAGDVLQANLIMSNHKDMKNGLVQYESAYGQRGEKWRASYSKMDYDFKSRGNNYEGQTTTYELGTTVPMERDLLKSNFWDLAFRHRVIRDDMLFGGFYPLKSKKHTDVIEGTIKGYTRSNHDALNYYLTNSFGWLTPNTDYARLQMEAGKKNHTFGKTSASLYYMYKFRPRLTGHFSVNGQYSWGKNLDSSEQFYIGGPNAVRAFTSGEANGDAGVLGTAELRYDTKCKGLQLTAFYDIGYARYDAHRASLNGDNYCTLAGAGIGLMYTKSRNYYIKLDWAFPLTDDSDHNDDLKSRLWFRFVKQI